MDASSRLRVLVIDDDPDLIALLTRGLEVLGHYDVAAATDGAQGLQQVEATRPDCVVVDVRMPTINGHQFVRALRGDPATAAIPVIILSALIQDHEQLAGMLSGADAYLIKPVRLAELIHAIEQALQISDEQRYRRATEFAADGSDEAGS